MKVDIEAEAAGGGRAADVRSLCIENRVSGMVRNLRYFTSLGMRQN